METESRRLYVGNLPFTVESGAPMSEETLGLDFRAFGKITDVIVMRDKESGRHRGFAFIEFSTADEAKAALKLHQTDYHGRTLTVQIANPRRSQAPCAPLSD